MVRGPGVWLGCRHLEGLGLEGRGSSWLLLPECWDDLGQDSYDNIYHFTVHRLGFFQPAGDLK